MRVFFVDVDKKDNVYFSDEDKNHLLKVLRIKVASTIKCCNKKDKSLILVKVISLNPFKANIVKQLVNNIFSFVDITCYLAIIKKNNFELATQKLNEIGIKKIVPFKSLRSQNNIFLDIDRLKKIVDESSKQCNRNPSIEISEPIDFDMVINQLKEFNNVLVAENVFDSIDLSQTLNTIKNPVAFLIGPEGGFDKIEIDKLSQLNNINFVKLTNTILKAETASIYLASVLVERIKNE